MNACSYPRLIPCVTTDFVLQLDLELGRGIDELASPSRCGRTRGGRPRGRRSGRSGLRLLHVSRDDLERAAELLGRAELHHFGPGVEDRRVSRTDVVRVAGLEQLFAAARTEPDFPADYVAHVRALALVVGKALEQRCEVGVLGVGLEAHRPAALEV